MEGSCTDDSTTSDALSASAAPPPPSTGKSSQGLGLCRMGSGASVILDAADSSGVVCSAESKKLPSSKYKGVVPQPNGRWGAQIYEKHQRVWLGTFNDEDEAARSYDVAAQRFRGRDAVINFKPLSDQNDAVEIAFLSSHSKAEIVDMLRKHTYSDELAQSRRHFKVNPGGVGVGVGGTSRWGGYRPREQLFEKTVTPSDVGKLNRLVIPKQHAEKHFPVGAAGGGGKGLLMNFEDGNGKVWRFRYSYWNSSQSYVLTKGWSRFVKDNTLKAGDTVCFHRSTFPGDSQLYIDCRRKTTSSTSTTSHSVLNLGDRRPAARPTATATPSIRLFGVDIIKSGEGDGRKRGRDGEEECVVLDMDMVMCLGNSRNKRMVTGDGPLLIL